MNVFLFLILSSFFSQKTNCNDSIIGRWQEVKVTYKNGETGENVTLDGKPFIPRYHLEFDDNNVGIDLTMSQSPMPFSYELKECVLSLGNRKFRIEKLSEKELVLLELDDLFPNDEYAFRRFFIKN